MEEMDWLYVRYPGDFENDSTGISFPFRLPKNLSFVELYDKLIKKLQIDSNLYEMVLRCPNPFSPKYPPFVIDDDETVEWLMSHCQGTCLHVNLKNLNANEVGGSNRRVMPMHNGREDINCVANDDVEEDDTNWQPEIVMNDNVEVSPLVGVDESVGVGVGVDVSDTLLALVDDSCLIPPIDTSHEVENRIEVCVDSLSDGLNDIEPTSMIEDDNAVPSSSDIPAVYSWTIPNDEDVHKDDVFPTKDDLITRLKDLAIGFHFEFKTMYSDTKRIGLKCRNKGCLWWLRATCMGDSSEKFVVRVYKAEHSCPLTTHQTYHKQADSDFVCSNIEEKFQDPKRLYPPRDIINDFEEEFGHKVSYTVAYNAQKKAMAAVRGRPSDN